MVHCWAIECNHNNIRETCRFFRLPTEEKERKRWLKLLRRDTKEIPKAVFICSCHFREGKTENGPEIFSFNVEKKFPPHYLTPEKKWSRRKIKQVLFSEETPQSSEIPSTSNDVGSLTDVPSTSKDILESDSASSQLDVPSTSKGTQVNLSDAGISLKVLEAENFFLQQDLKKISEETAMRKFTYDLIRNDEKLITLYTGLPDSKVFDALYNLIQDLDIEYILKYKVEKISRKDQLLMTLMKLRQNFPHADLAFRFQVSSTTVTNVVITWIHVLYEILYKQLMSKIPSRNKNKSCLPNSFSNFTNCRIILDCTEIYTVVARKNMANQKLTFSTYKHRNTLKALVGVASNGVITYLSQLYPGSTSDKKIVQNCGILDQFTAGDLIIADKGFLIRDLLSEGVHLNIPPFLNTPKFTQQQVQQTERIARARIHVERAIRRIKCFKILNLIPSNLKKYANVIFKTVGALTNLQYPLIKEVEHLYEEN